MKIQSLAIMFIIIILPISLVMQTYVQNRVETLSMQSQYDSKLTSATYDSLKAYQLNSFNNDTSDLTNSKIRDIEAAVNTFFSSLATNFSTLGYNKESLQSYVPALVFTMYDGYYIYSPYTNTWDKETNEKHRDDSSFQNDQKLYGLKPYVYYSCRYIKDRIDVVITYSMDNYISIQGMIDDDVVSKYGYILSNVSVSGDNVTYNGVGINSERILKENALVDGNITEYEYIKQNGTKYYKNTTGEIFSMLNGKKQVQKDFIFPSRDDSAKKYYTEAAEMKKFINDLGLANLTINDAVDINGNKYENSPFTQLGNNGNGKIFDFDHNGGIEAEDSNFNTHRVDVIKYSIERNLSVAITNYNNYSTVSTDFQMPKLKDTDWDKIIDNISIITFLQGMNVGGKIYNGYSVITNTKNEDVVTEDSIYIKTGEGENTVFHRATESGLESKIDSSSVGIFNIDLERKSGNDENGITKYFYPKVGTLSYDSIVTQNSVNKNNVIDNAVKKLYYTALGRERYCMYREKLEIK